jgi:AraC-like DNA-binding protein
MDYGAASSVTRVSSFRGRLSQGATMVADRRPGYAASPHTHDCDMLFVPVLGRFEFVDAWERRLHSAPGNFIWLGADAAHATTAQTMRQTHLAVYIDPELWSTVLHAHRAGRPEQGLRSGSAALSAVAQRALECSDGGETPAAWSGALVMEAARLCAQPLLEDLPGPAAHLPALLADHIEHQLESPLAIDAFAEHQRISRRHLERIFRAVHGVSPLAFQQAKRAERARYLLEHTDQSVLSIAQQVGWESASYLVKMMRRAWGMSASQFRANRHENA